MALSLRSRLPLILLTALGLAGCNAPPTGLEEGAASPDPVVKTIDDTKGGAGEEGGSGSGGGEGEGTGEGSAEGGGEGETGDGGGTGEGGGEDPSPPGETCSANPRQAVLDVVNRIRAEHALPPLILDLRLASAAQGHSQDMADHNFVAHIGSDGSSPSQRITAAGYNWSSWTENVAAGQPTAEEVVEAWMGSSGHRANILRELSEHVGIGHAFSDSTYYGHYWTVDFGSSTTEPQSGDGCQP